MTSAYGRGRGPIHSRRSRISGSTTFDTAAFPSDGPIDGSNHRRQSDSTRRRRPKSTPGRMGNQAARRVSSRPSPAGLRPVGLIPAEGENNKFSGSEHR
jgi:hypothetical protein